MFTSFLPSPTDSPSRKHRVHSSRYLFYVGTGIVPSRRSFCISSKYSVIVHNILSPYGCCACFATSWAYSLGLPIQGLPAGYLPTRLVMGQGLLLPAYSTTPALIVEVYLFYTIVVHTTSSPAYYFLRGLLFVMLLAETSIKGLDGQGVNGFISHPRGVWVLGELVPLPCLLYHITCSCPPSYSSTYYLSSYISLGRYNNCYLLLPDTLHYVSLLFQ